MMNGCSDKVCQTRLNDVYREVFGNGKHKRIRECLADKVPKKWLWIGFIVLAVPLIPTALKVWVGTETFDLRFVDKPTFYSTISELRDKEQNTKYRLDLQAERFNSICTALAKIEQGQIDLKKVQTEIKSKLDRIAGSHRNADP